MDRGGKPQENFPNDEGRHLKARHVEWKNFGVQGRESQTGNTRDRKPQKPKKNPDETKQKPRNKSVAHATSEKHELSNFFIYWP